MNQKAKAIITHTFFWSLFLSIPIYIYLSSSHWASKNITYFIIKAVIACTLLVTSFYFNYHYLVPKFLFPKKYFQYSALLFAFWFISEILPVIIIKHTGNPSNLFNNPALKSSRPFGLLLFTLMFILVLVTSIALRVNSRWKQTEKERLAAQLAYLKTQINPHFLFNILNNIYSEAIDKSPRAADMIERLSGMMRYTLRETQNDFVQLEDEIDYITNYIELQKVGFDSTVQLKFKTSGYFYDKQIAPLILITFIENAFKHGVNSEQDSNIAITIDVKNHELHLEVLNKKVVKETNFNDKSGLGIENTKHRLELLYPNKHLLSIDDNSTTFNISLYINLS
jgi:sensor histidine kinase YesM